MQSVSQPLICAPSTLVLTQNAHSNPVYSVWCALRTLEIVSECKSCTVALDLAADLAPQLS